MTNTVEEMFKVRWIKSDRVFCTGDICTWRGERVHKESGYVPCPRCASELVANGVPIRRIRELRGMPFLQRGMRVEVAGNMGTIVSGNDSANLNVRIDGRPGKDNCHPTWNIRYFDQEGNVIRDYTEK